MASRDSDSLFDLRTVKRNLRAGRLSRTTYAEFLESLPDVADNVMTREEREAEDAFDDLSSTIPDAETAEASGAPQDSMAAVRPQVQMSVPAALAAPEATLLQPPATPKPPPLPPPATVEPPSLQQPPAPEATPAPVPPSSSVTPDTAESDDPFADAPLPGQMAPALSIPAQPAAADDHEPDGD